MKINPYTTLSAVCLMAVSALSFGCAEWKPLSSARRGSVAHAHTVPTGTTVTIKNAVVINTVDLIFDDEKRIFQIQDSTGGISIYGTNEEIEPLLEQFQTGDEITIRGVVGEYQGLFELVPPLELVKVKRRMPIAISVTPADLQNDQTTAEELESQVVILHNVRFVGIKPGARFTAPTIYQVTDGKHTAIVKIRSQGVPHFDKLIPTEPVDIRGVVMQFGESTDPNEMSAHYVHPRFADDIKLVKQPKQAMVSE